MSGNFSGRCLIGSILVLLACTFVSTSMVAQVGTNAVMLTKSSIGSLPQGKKLQSMPWRFHPGDSSVWKNPAINDMHWRVTHTNFGTNNPLPEWDGMGWFRCWLTVDSSLHNTMLALRINHDGASEIYLDGLKIAGFGKLGNSKDDMVSVREPNYVIPITLDTGRAHLLAIRYSNYNAYFPDFIGFQTWIGTYDQVYPSVQKAISAYNFLLHTVYAQLAIALLHLFLFIYYPSQKANLYHSLFVSCCAASVFCVYFNFATDDPSMQRWVDAIFNAAVVLATLTGTCLLYALSDTKLPKWKVITGTLVGGTFLYLNLMYPDSYAHDTGFLLNAIRGFFLIVILDGLWTLWKAIQKGKPGIWLVGIGMTVVVVFFFVVGIDVFNLWKSSPFQVDQLMAVGFLVLLVFFSLYLAGDFARTNKTLAMQIERIGKQEIEKRTLIAEQARRLEQTVIERTAEVQKQADRLREMDAVKSRFVINLTHEFRTPLSLILGPAEKIQSESQDKSATFHAALIKENASRLLNLVNQLLDLGKLESGKMDVTLQSCDLITFTKQILNTFSPLAEKGNIQIEFESTHESLFVQIDRNKVEIILHNLISNALKFSRTGGRIVVNVAIDRNDLLIDVRDSGIGIPAAKIPYVFDRFYQVDPADTRTRGGAGIGLALTKELVNLMEGFITISSQENVGTTVSVKLPVKAVKPGEVFSGNPDVVSPPAPLLEPVVVDTKEQDDQSPLVLVVEDHEELRRFIRSSLEQHFRVIEASNGKAGVRLALDHVPDAVISDVMMPLMDGYEVCTSLKNHESTSHIPIVLLTAKTDFNSKVGGWNSGADGYLTKPFHAAELLALVKNLITQRRQLAEHYRNETAPGRKVVLPSMEQIFMTKLLAVINDHIADEQFSVERLGDEMGLSRTQLHRKLKAIINQSPGELIREIRLQRALELLKVNAGTVSEIAYQVGFSVPSSFSSSFSKHFGYSPSDVKKGE